MAQYDFSKSSTENLLTKWRWHDQDRGCMTVEAECRRMYVMQEIGKELQQRGVDLPA